MAVEVEEPDSRHIEMSGMRRLASAVMIAAVADLQRGHTGRPSYDAAFQSAKELLCVPNWDLEFWCSLTNINQVAVMERSLQMLKQKSTPVALLKKRYAVDPLGAPIHYGEVACPPPG